MRRIRIVVLWIGIVLLLLPATASAAQEDAHVTLTAVKGEGAEIVLTLGVRDVSFNALQIALAFDPEKLEPRSAEDGTPAEDGESMTEYLAPIYWRGEGWMQCEYGTYSAEEGVAELTLYVDQGSRGEADGSDADGYVAAGEQGLDLVSLHFTLKETAGFTADTIELTEATGNDDTVVLSTKNPENPRTPIVEKGRWAAVRDFTALGIALSETEGPEKPAEEEDGTEENPGGDNGNSGGATGGSGSGSNGGSGGAGGFGDTDTNKDSQTPTQPGGGSQTTQPGQENQSGSITQPGGTGGVAALTDMKGHWAQSYVADLVARGLVSGNPDGTFRPEAQLSRGEFCAVLCKMAGLSPASGENRFSDLNGSWAAPYVNVLAEAGRVSGVGNRLFAPDRAVSRQEAAVLLSSVLKLPETERKLTFTDTGSIEPWAADAVARTVAAGLFGGYEDGSMRPEGWIARGEMAAVVSRGLAWAE